ncbi:MAG: 2-dehydropantoate 2-reductase [Rhizobiaceae bacterium]
MDNTKIIIAGAGSVGCFVGGLLAAAKREVTFLGRKRITEDINRFGLHLTDFSGMDVKLDSGALVTSITPEILSSADVILVCVKSGATIEMGELIGNYARDSAVVVSLQNGVNNADTLRGLLPEYDVRAGMVSFNVVQMGKGRFHRGTSGKIVIEAGDPELAPLLGIQNLPVQSDGDMKSVLWGKLLVNLNNALNALSGLPLVDELADRNWRLKLAEQMSEALQAMKAENIAPRPPSPVPAWILPHILRLPTPVFRLVAKQMLSIDPAARSSMWEDLKNGRKTEIGELQGEIVRLGEKHGIPTPENHAVMGQIYEREQL